MKIQSVKKNFLLLPFFCIEIPSCSKKKFKKGNFQKIFFFQKLTFTSSLISPKV